MLEMTCGNEYGKWSARKRSNISYGEPLTIATHSGLTWNSEAWTLITDVWFATTKGRTAVTSSSNAVG
jgi:hypothetical protein